MAFRLGRSARAPLTTLRIAAVATAVPALMRLPVPRLEAVLEPRRPRAEVPPEAVGELVAHVDGVLARLRRVLGDGCLLRGVTRFWFLRRAGLPVDLVFGTGRPEKAFEGHCWLDLGGAPFLERQDPRPVFSEVFRVAHRAAR